jgi:hypothetical protein
MKVTEMKTSAGFSFYATAIALCAGLIIPPFSPHALAQSPSQAVKPSVIAGGGGVSSSGNIQIEATIGQSLAGTSGNGSFSLNVGFWPAAFTDACLSLSQTSQSFSASGGNGTVDILGLAGCAWTATSNDPGFITVTSGPGSGNGTVTYTVASHSATSRRVGTITIANQTFTVLQGAAFTDVPVGHPFYNEIGKLSARGITTGCTVSTYCPTQLVTREQMAAFIIRTLGDFEPPTPPLQRFTDVPASNPFSAFIEQMAVRQITLGCGLNTYCPSDPVTREQMAAFILRGLGEFSPPTPPSQRFNDVAPSNPFYNFIDRMAVLNITLGCSVSPPLYCPTSTVTREQMAAFLVRAFNL